MTESPSAAPGKSRRNVLTIRLRTMVLLVVAAALGISGWQYHERLHAVRALVACLNVRVLVSIGPTNWQHDPVHDASGTYAPAIREVRRLHGESMAVSRLIGELRAARLAGDETRMRGALAAMQDLGPATKPAAPEVLRVVRGEGFPPNSVAPLLLVQGLAVHVLAKIARDDPAQLPALIDLIDHQDTSPGAHLRNSALGELTAFKAEGRDALPILLRLLADRKNLPPNGSGDGVIHAVAAIGPDAREALPALKEIARDRALSGWTRRSAIHAVTSILPPLRNKARADFAPDLLSFLGEFSDDADPQVAQAAGFTLRQVQLQADADRRREETRQLIAADRARGGRPRPPAQP